VFDVNGINVGALSDSEKPEARKIPLYRGDSKLSWDSLVITRMPDGVVASVSRTDAGSFELKVTVNPLCSLLGLHREDISIGFADGIKRLSPIIDIPLMYDVESDVSVGQKSLYLGFLQINQKKEVGIKLNYASKKHISRILVECGDPFAISKQAYETGVNHSTVSFDLTVVSKPSVTTEPLLISATIDNKEYRFSIPMIFKIL
jgi:hypothetical protein